MKSIAITILFGAVGLAQTPPAIEVATVKQNKSGDVAVDQQIDPGRMRFTIPP